MQRIVIAVFVALLVVLICAEERQPPPFLKGATPEQITDFYKLIDADGDKTEAQIDQDVEGFVNKLGGDFPKQFTDFKAEVKKAGEEYEEAHQKAVATLSQPAQEADKKMTAIANNQDLTAEQKRQQIEAIMKALPESVQDEIKKALSQ